MNRSTPAPPPQSRPTFTDEDLSFILRTTLHPDHHANPTVVAFIRSYLSHRSVSQASREVGITTQQGASLRNRKDIHTAITKVTEAMVNKFGFDAEEVVERVKEIAFFDPVTLLNPDGTFIENLNDVPAEARRAIKKLKVKNLYEPDPNGFPRVVGKVVEYEFWSKDKHIEMLGREKNLFKETKKLELDVTNNMKDVLLESENRAEARMRALQERAKLPPPIDVTPIPATVKEPVAMRSAFPVPPGVKRE